MFFFLSLLFSNGQFHITSQPDFIQVKLSRYSVSLLWDEEKKNPYSSYHLKKKKKICLVNIQFEYSVQRITAKSIRIQPTECVALRIVIVSDGSPMRWVYCLSNTPKKWVVLHNNGATHSMDDSDVNDLAPNRLTDFFFFSSFSFFLHFAKW